MKIQKLAVICLIIGLACLIFGCQNKKVESQENKQELSSESTVQTDSGITDGQGEEIDFSERIQKAFEKNEIYSAERGFEFGKAEWGSSVDQISEALGVMFDTAPVLAGKDSFAYPSVGYTEIFGYEAKAQAEVYQEQVRSLTFRMDSMEDPDKIYTVIKQCIENRCGAPSRESASGIPAKKSVWEQGDTSLTLVYTGNDIRINMGEGLDTVHIDPTEIKAEHLKNEAGEYEVQGAAWGIDEAATAQALGLRFYDIPVSMNDTLVVYPSRDETMILGYTARVNAEYHEDGLAQLTFEIETDDTEAAFGRILQELETQYGKDYTVTERAENERISYRWSSGSTPETALILSKTGNDIAIDFVRF